MLIWLAIVTNDPLDIIYNPAKNMVGQYRGLYFSEIAFILQVLGIIACLITISWCLIKLLFENNPQQIAEEKAEIVHRFYIILLIGSFVFLFNTVFSVVQGFF